MSFQAITYRKQVIANNICKGFANGEGSRGGVIVRHTKGGNPVYDAHAHVPTKKVQPKKEQWFDKYKKYNLSVYPVGIDQHIVKVNTSGDINSHAILTWKDPKTGYIKNAYTKEFLDRNAEKKWQRINGITDKDVNAMKRNATSLLKGEEVTKTKDAATIIAIILHTGLRRGNRLKFKSTGNRGVSTLAANNVKVEGDRVIFSFTGKSYQENNAELKDKKVADYITKLKKQRAKSEFLFETGDTDIDKTFNAIGGKNLNIKDLRTYVATDLARKLLLEDKTQPPPVPKGADQKKIKKLVQEKLKSVYEKVSQKLNNTPAMARTAYVHPEVVNGWLASMGVDFDINKAIGDDLSSLAAIYLNSDQAGSKAIEIDEDDEELCDEFNLPDWWDESLTREQDLQKSFQNLIKC